MNHQSGRKARQSVFFPIHARAHDAIDQRHAFLDVERLRENRVPPVRVFEPMRRRRATQELKSAVNGHREGVRRSQYSFLRGQVSAAAAATRLLADMEKAIKSALGQKAQSQSEQ